MTPQPAADQAKDITLVGYGFTFFPGDTNILSYGVLIYNPNPDRWVGDVSLNLTFYGPDGSVVGSEDEHIRTALPGQKAAIGATTYPDSKVTKMEVAMDTTWTETSGTTGAFTITKARTVKDTYTTETTGLITSSFAEKQTLVQVNAIYRNTAGRIVGGSFTYVDSIAPGKTVSFKMSEFDTFRDLAKTEVYAMP